MVWDVDSGDLRKHVLDGGCTLAPPGVRLNRPRAAAMRPFCRIALATCIRWFSAGGDVLCTAVQSSDGGRRLTQEDRLAGRHLRVDEAAAAHSRRVGQVHTELQ